LAEANDGSGEKMPSDNHRRSCSLLCLEGLGIFIYVSQKEIVLDVISELPDEVSLEQIAEKIEFLAAIQKGMDQLDRGEGIPHEEVKRQLAAWLAS
jgi:hypothetical protein